jgi:hypothetical protein
MREVVPDKLSDRLGLAAGDVLATEARRSKGAFGSALSACEEREARGRVKPSAACAPDSTKVDPMQPRRSAMRFIDIPDTFPEGR